MPQRLHLTIGEVLSLLKTEFPDVSISKIRFLESQGLVDPERTPSGYRKFYEHDVDQLRWVLLQQKEHFLPLKVIKDRLDDGVDFSAPSAAPASHAAPASNGVPAGSGPAGSNGAPGATDAASDDNGVGQVSSAAATPPPLSRPAIGGSGGQGTSAPREPSVNVTSIAPHTTASPAPRSLADTTSPGLIIDDSPTSETPVGAVPATPEVYSTQELADAAGCSTQLIRDLTQFGLLNPASGAGGATYYEPEALNVARLGARFDELGVEPRHLRAWRTAADKESTLFEQLVMPLLRQRNPDARREAKGRLSELASLGGRLRGALVEESLKGIR